jgi:hypothetical protein
MRCMFGTLLPRFAVKGGSKPRIAAWADRRATPPSKSRVPSVVLMMFASKAWPQSSQQVMPAVSRSWPWLLRRSNGHGENQEGSGAAVVWGYRQLSLN